MPALPLPRFLRAFLAIAALIALPTLYVAYTGSSAIAPEEDLRARTEVHWNAGGVGPAVDEETEDGEWGVQDVKGSGGETEVLKEEKLVELDQEVVRGGVIMDKLGNATAKAELGRATWKLLHLMTLRFPDEPTKDQRDALKSYFHLFSRLYPCGECAAEFQKLLEEYPPQTSSRKTASLWLCALHNRINVRLGKDEFDCTTLDAAYDCGCGDDPGALLKGTDKAGGGNETARKGAVEEVSGERGQAANADGAADEYDGAPLPFGHTPVDDMRKAYEQATNEAGSEADGSGISFLLEEVTDE